MPQNRIKKVFLAIEQHMFDRTQRDRTIMKRRRGGIVEATGIHRDGDDLPAVILP
jgi:hypothetical protein